ncbi:hypothetical protein GVAV_000915 [Gurleya vavrai]
MTLNDNEDRERLKAEIRAELLQEDRKRRIEKRVPHTLHTIIQKLFTICDNNDFNLKILDFTLQSLSLTKQSFIDKISQDVNTTARFLKYFPGNENFINYSDITLLAHVLIYCLDFNDVPAVENYRNKINARDIWSIKNMQKGKIFDIIDKVRQRVSVDEVEKVRQEVLNWYSSLEKQFY